MMARRTIILCLLIAASIKLTDAQVPGAVYTESGYDNADGEDAICWSAPAYHNHTAVEEVLEGEEHGHDDEELESESFNGINWRSELVPSFVAGPTTMMATCPAGTTVHVDILPEKVYGSYRLRTNRMYTYHVTGRVDLQEIREQYELSDNSFFHSSDGLHDIGLRIEFCPVNGNLCSPFVLERFDEDELIGHVHKEGDTHDGAEDGGDHIEDEHSEEENHDDEHGDEHDHDGHRIRKRVLQSGIRATQIVAFNITFDDPDEEFEQANDEVHFDGDENHADEHNDEEDHDEGVHVEDHAQEEDHELGEDHGDEDHGDENHSVNHEGHDGEEDAHNHDSDHEGHSLEIDESRVKFVSSPLFLIPVDISNQTMFEFHLDVDVQVEVPGNYLPLASLQFFLSNETIHGHAVGIDADAAFKFDVANLLHQRAVFYYEQANIQTVSMAIESLSYVIIAIAGMVQLFCLCATAYYREHSVMKLSQGSFLMLLQGAGIVATSCTFLYNPKSDAYCILQSPLTLIPLQFMFAVVFGRLRRIIRIMAPLMNWNSPQSSRNVKSGLKAWKQSFMMRRSSGSFSSRDGSKGSHQKASKASSQSSTNGEEMTEPQTVGSQSEAAASSQPARSWKPMMFCRGKNLRQKFTAGRLWLVIVIIILPIVIIEAVGLAVFLPKRTLDMNAEQSIGRYECGTHNEQVYYLSSTAILLVTIFLCLFEAQRSRRLPGLFNEAESVSFALLSSLFVGGLGFAVIIVSAEAHADPNAPYIMEVVLVSYIATILVVRLTLPKLRLIWKGEKVVIANMLADHRKSHQKVESSGYVTGLSESRQASDSEPLDKMEDGTRRASISSGIAANTLPSISETDKSVHFDESAEKRASDSSVVSPSPEPARSKKPLIIRSGEEPPDRLMLRVVRHANTISRVNERILSGLQVNRDDWEGVKASLDELHGLLENVEYI